MTVVDWPVSLHDHSWTKILVAIPPVARAGCCATSTQNAIHHIILHAQTFRYCLITIASQYSSTDSAGTCMWLHHSRSELTACHECLQNTQKKTYLNQCCCHQWKSLSSITILQVFVLVLCYRVSKIFDDCTQSGEWVLTNICINQLNAVMQHFAVKNNNCLLTEVPDYRCF